MVQDGKSSQEYLVHVGVPRSSIFGPTSFLLYNNDLPDDFICNIAFYADDITHYHKCGQESNMWQQLELPPELASDLQLLGNRAKKDLLISMLEKFNLFHLTGLILVPLMWKWMGLFFRKKSSFKITGLSFFSRLDWVSYVISIAKTTSRKIGTLIHSDSSFFLLRLLCMSLNLPQGLAWNLAMHGLALYLGWCS